MKPDAEQTRYRLQVRLEITRQTRYPNDDYWRPSQDRLNVDESLDLGELDFAGLMAVLAQLHEAVKAIAPTPEEAP